MWQDHIWGQPRREEITDKMDKYKEEMDKVDSEFQLKHGDLTEFEREFIDQCTVKLNEILRRHGDKHI